MCFFKNKNCHLDDCKEESSRERTSEYGDFSFHFIPFEMTDFFYETIVNQKNILPKSEGLNGLDVNHIKIYPNPSSNGFKVWIDFENATTPYEIEIINLFGEVVYNETIINREENNINELRKPGLYIYKIVLKNQIVKKGKLIIQ